MPQITIQFSAEGDLGSWLIRAFEHGCLYSHVDSVLPDGRLIGARSDPTPKTGVWTREPGYAPFARTCRFSLEASQEVADDYYGFVKSQEGKPYDNTAIRAFALDRDWRRDDAWFCSELVTAGLERMWLASCGYHPRFSSPASKIDPGDLYLVLSLLPQVTVATPWVAPPKRA